MKNHIFRRKMNYKIMLSSIVVLLMFTQNTIGQMKYKVYAGFINHFTKYIQWPPHTKAGDFVIAVVGDSPLFNELQPLVGKTVGDQNIVLKNYKKPTDITNAHIIFLSEQNKSMANVVEKIAMNLNALLVTEFESACKKGADINFVEVDGKIRFEISTNNLESHGLKVSNELKKLGILID